MAQGTQPRYILKRRLWMQQVSTINTNRDGSGTLATILTAHATEGTRIERVDILAETSTITDGMVRFFLDDAGGNIWLWYEATIDGSFDATSTVAGLRLILPAALFPLEIPAAWLFRASVEKSEIFNIFAQGGDYA